MPEYCAACLQQSLRTNCVIVKILTVMRSGVHMLKLVDFLTAAASVAREGHAISRVFRAVLADHLDGRAARESEELWEARELLLPGLPLDPKPLSLASSCKIAGHVALLVWHAVCHGLYCSEVDCNLQWMGRQLSVRKAHSCRRQMTPQVVLVLCFIPSPCHDCCAAFLL